MAGREGGLRSGYATRVCSRRQQKVRLTERLFWLNLVWMPWPMSGPMSGLVAWTLSWFGHGQRVGWSHGRYHGFGMDALANGWASSTCMYVCMCMYDVGSMYVCMYAFVTLYICILYMHAHTSKVYKGMYVHMYI